VSPDEDPFDHPDAQRRFRVVDNVEKLERALYLARAQPDTRVMLTTLSRKGRVSSVVSAMPLGLTIRPHLMIVCQVCV